MIRLALLLALLQTISGGTAATVSGSTGGATTITGTLPAYASPPTFNLGPGGAVAVSNLPATQPVTGAVAVSNLPATQPVTGTVAVSNLPATQPVTVSNLPANQVTTAFPGDHIALFAGTAYSASTGVQAIAANNYLNARLVNNSTAASCTVILRRASNLSAATLTYWSGNSPAVLASSTTVTPGNRYVGGPSNVASSAAFTWNTSTTAAVPPTAPSDGISPTGGHDEVVTEKGLAPGASLGLTIGGTGGGLAAAGQAAITMAWYGC